MFVRPQDMEPTKRAGAYRLVEHIASGGMGVVYLAERDDGQVRHQAAVKILRRGLDAEDQVRRFTAERQILASLEHPNIARLIDAGITDDARPYFVMEYVDGEQIDLYADRQRLSVAGRVALIRDVARAVDFAHRHLVVHRDLKPSNILVTGTGQVKLLDFGIAKLLDTDPDDATMVTMPGMRLMTPGYASPEQITGGRVTTATDVYVLGLLLYELLTGTRAQDTDGRSLPDIEQIVVHGAVPRPSDAVRTSVETEAATTSEVPATSVAEARSTTPARLRRQLRGDLDRIVAMALRKEPERRYASAAAMAEDLDRYLKGEAIVARGDSRAYRVGKFVRRRWPAVVAAALFLALLVAYAVTVTMQSRQIRAERDRAQAAQRKAEEVTAFLVRMFQASDPSETRGDTITAKDLLARGVERVDALEAQPEVQAQLLDVMGRVYQSLGRFDRAQPLLERALKQRRLAFGDASREVAESWLHLGELSSLQSKLPEAESQLRQALTLHDALVGRESAEAAADLQLLGAVLVDKGEYAQGRRHFEEALAIRQRVLPPGDPETAESLSGLAYAASHTGDYAEMERRYSEALDLLRTAFGNRHPRVALTINNLASAIDNLGRYDEAARLHQEALAMRRQLFGDDHPAVATSLNNLGNIYLKQGKYDQAEPLYRQVVELRKRLLGPDHRSTGTAVNNLAVLLFRAGKPAEAEVAIREARAIALKGASETHPFVLAIDTSLASMIAAQGVGRDAEAERLFTRTLAARMKVLGPEHLDVAAGSLAYGRFLNERKRHAEAGPLLEKAHTMRVAALGATHPETVRAARDLVLFYRATGADAKAQALETGLNPR